MSDFKDLDGKWEKGISSLYSPSFIQKGEYAWLLNGDNVGGVISPRPGFNAILGSTPLPAGQAKGLTVFTDLNGQVQMVAAIGSSLYSLPYPFNGPWTVIPGDGFTGVDPVFFCTAYYSLTLNHDGTTNLLPEPYPVLVMQDGTGKACTWIGAGFPVTALASEEDPDNPEIFNVPIGKAMEWSGDRLWVACGNKLKASDLGDPVHFHEINYVAGGGSLFFEHEIIGLNQTNNLQSLLVGTSYDISAVQSNVFDRTQWANTPGFQQVIIPGIGVSSGKSFCRQWGMVWWYSHGGLIALDQALNTYRTSLVQFQDQGMMKSKSKLAKDLSGVVIRPFWNYLAVGVPYASKTNSQIWILNQKPIEVAQPQIAEAYRVPVWSAAWNGIFPMDMTMVVINGQQRLFALSSDPVTKNNIVWEMFTGERRDRRGSNTTNPPVVFATRMMMLSEDLKQFEYADLDFLEMSGVVNIQVQVAGRKGSFHTIMQKRVVASRGCFNSVISSAVKGFVKSSTPKGSKSLVVTTNPGSVGLQEPNSDFVTPASGSTATIFIRGIAVPYTAYDPVTKTFTCTVPFDLVQGDQVIQPQFFPDSIFQSFRPQMRMLRSRQWNDRLDPDCQGCGVESQWNDRIDRGFQLIVSWTGQATLEGIRTFGGKWQEQAYGLCEEDELTARASTQLGCGIISDNLEFDTTTSASKTSQLIPVFTSRIMDVDYHADTGATIVPVGK